MKITIIPGDGIGPEVVTCTTAVLEAAGAELGFEFQEMGQAALKKFGAPLPAQTLASIKKNKIALKGPTATPIAKGFRSVNVALRKALDLYAGVRVFRSFAGALSPFRDVDIVMIRENIEDLYAGIEFAPGTTSARALSKAVKKLGKEGIAADAASALQIVSRHASRRIAEFACQYILAKKRRKITIGHKANILKFTDGLFLKTAQAVVRKCRRISFEDMLVDNLAQQLVLNPRQFDVVLLPNLYGDILSGLAAGLVGGLGVVPGANIGKECAVFEPAHGTAPTIVGKNIANPTATILSAAMMLEHIGQEKIARRIRRAVEAVIRKGKFLTPDIAPKRAATQKQFVDAVIKNL